MNGRWFLRAALVLLIAGAVTLLGIGAYQAGLAAGLAAGGAAVAPAPVYGWYPGGFGFGVGFLGFLGTLLFFFLLFGLLRAALGGGPRRWADDGHRRPWEGRARDAFETWHREAHEGSTPAPREPDAGATFGRS